MADVLPSPDCEGLPWYQRALDALIHGWVALRGFGRKVLRPGSTVLAAAVLVAAVANIWKAQDPEADAWAAGNWGALLLIISGTVAGLGYFLVTLGYRRRLKTEESDAALYKTCRSVAQVIAEEGAIERERVGVHVWSVAGPPGLKHLIRRTKFLDVERPESAVTWRRGRGAIGLCWAEQTEEIWDLEDLQDRAPTREHFCEKLTAYERMGLHWSEFANTKHYSAAWVYPLFKEGGGHKVVGCLSVDIVEVGGAASKLEAAVRNKAQELRSHRSVLQAQIR